MHKNLLLFENMYTINFILTHVYNLNHRNNIRTHLWKTMIRYSSKNHKMQITVTHSLCNIKSTYKSLFSHLITLWLWIIALYHGNAQNHLLVTRERSVPNLVIGCSKATCPKATSLCPKATCSVRSLSYGRLTIRIWDSRGGSCHKNVALSSSHP